MATLESKKAATLGKKSIIGMILGLALGAILCFVPNGYVRDDIIINTILNIVGNGYLNLIKMTIIPFVFASLVMGISSATDVKQVGRIGGKILIIYVATTVVASAFGILGGMILKPGVGVDLGSFDLSNTYENVNTSFASVTMWSVCARRGGTGTMTCGQSGAKRKPRQHKAVGVNSFIQHQLPIQRLLF